MVVVMFMSVALSALLCILAYNLAVYALPFRLGLTLAQFAYGIGPGLIRAGLVGLFSAGAAFGILAGLFETIRSPVIRLIIALIFGARRRRGLCAGLWRHQGSCAVRHLAANLQHRWLYIRQILCVGASGSRCRTFREVRARNSAAEQGDGQS